jgi:hypothetical protein
MLPDMDRRNHHRHASKGAVTVGDIVGRVGMLESPAAIASGMGGVALTT